MDREMVPTAKELLQRLIDDNPSAAEEEIYAKFKDELERDKSLRATILKEIYEALLKHLES
jgi:hypothetical protein